MGGTGVEKHTNLFVRYSGRIVNFFNFFKYCVFSLGVYFVNNTNITGGQVFNNEVWERFAKDSNEGEGVVMMPHYWTDGKSVWQRTQFFVGLISAWLIFHIITYLLLSRWRWDKR